jgi:hypothetical protein
VPPQCARCQQFYHVAANCHATPACAHCGQDHSSWECTRRNEPDFIPSCALCKLGSHGSRYRGCPYFRSLMERESRNNPQAATHSSNNSNHINSNYQSSVRRPSINNFGHPLHALPNMPPTINAWSQPLKFSKAPNPLAPHPLSSLPRPTYPKGPTYNSHFAAARNPVLCPSGIALADQIPLPPLIPDSVPETHSSPPSPTQPSSLTSKLSTNPSQPIHHNPPQPTNSSHPAVSSSLLSQHPPTSTPPHPSLHDHHPPLTDLEIPLLNFKLTSLLTVFVLLILLSLSISCSSHYRLCSYNLVFTHTRVLFQLFSILF